MAQHLLLAASCVLVIVYVTSVEGGCQERCKASCKQKSKPNMKVQISHVQCYAACAKLAKTCKSCSGPNHCSRCKDGYKPSKTGGPPCYPCSTGCVCNPSNKCVSCLPGFISTPDKGCVACPPGCICDPITADCTDCDSGYIRNALSTGPKCLACSAGCASCTPAGPGYCNTCKTGFVKVGLFCQACASNCLSCATAGANSCDTCKTGYKLVTGASSSTCAACPANCKSCDNAGPTYCDKCNDNYGLTFDHKNCQACAPNCLSCNKQGYNLCDPDQCASGTTYNAGTFVCTGATGIANCAVSSSATVCTTCVPGYTRFPGGGSADTCSSCTTTNCYRCPAAAGTCTKCNNGFTTAACTASACTTAPNCNACSGATCTDCYIGYTLMPPSGSASTTCLPCSVANCAICDTSQATCDQCAFGYNLVGGVCQASCDPNCATNTCTQKGPGKCDSYCNAGFQLDSNHICQQCALGCNSCVLKGPTFCDGPQCESGYTLTNNKCTK